MTPCAIFLCDKTGIAARPWADAGIECWCVDISHSIRRPRKVGNINFVWGDVRTWRPPPVDASCSSAPFLPARMLPAAVRAISSSRGA